PDDFAIRSISAQFRQGGVGGTLVGTITQNVDGSGGALLFAASTTTNPFDTIVLSEAPGGSDTPGPPPFIIDDFAFAQARFTAAAATPEPASLALLSLTAVGAGAYSWRKRKKVAVPMTAE